MASIEIVEDSYQRLSTHAARLGLILIGVGIFYKHAVPTELKSKDSHHIFTEYGRFLTLERFSYRKKHIYFFIVKFRIN